MSERLTKYEITRLIGVRSIQIEKGAKPLIDLSVIQQPTAYKIAYEELKQGKIPLIVVRTYPDGTQKEIKIFNCSK